MTPTCSQVLPSIFQVKSNDLPTKDACPSPWTYSMLSVYLSLSALYFPPAAAMTRPSLTTTQMNRPPVTNLVISCPSGGFEYSCASPFFDSISFHAPSSGQES